MYLADPASDADLPQFSRDITVMSSHLPSEYLLGKIFIAILLFLGVPTITNALFYNYVTCGSVIKILNDNYNARLHSHEVQYGSGSGQQSVTAIADMDDVNSHWVIKGTANTICTRGEPVKCGSTIRLEHLKTKKNLHSHLFSSPLSSAQEVSAFGVNGEGDTGDHWTIVCDSDSWSRDRPVLIKHTDTNMYLSLSGQRYGSPIPGQLEVCAVANSGSNAQWRATEGIFIKPADIPGMHHEHTEL